MAPHQFQRLNKQTQNTDHTECKLNHSLSKLQREAGDAITA